MQTIVVAPLPPQSSPPVNGGQSGQTSNESSFAPTLSKAISENSRSQTSSSSTASQTSQNNNHKDENTVATSTKHDQEVPENFEKPENNPQNSETMTVFGQNTVALNLQELQQAGFLGSGTAGPANGNSPLLSAATGISQFSKADIDKSLLDISKMQDQSQKVNQNQNQELVESKSLERVGLAYKFGDNQIQAGQNTPGNYSGLLQQSDISQVLVSNNTLETLQKNDSISWSQLRQQSSQDLLNFSGPVKLNMDNAAVSKEISNISTEKILANLTQIPVELESAKPLRNPSQLSLRQDISSQYIEAKIESKQGKGEQEQAKQFMDAEQNSAKPNMITQTTGKLSETSTESSFTQSLNHVAQAKVSQPSPDPIRPSYQPFSSAVSENEILEQVTNKFRISQHLQNSKLVMKLHPAELGNLKIDIQLKDGTINANIVAQTQQVQETLEKNMPRLKALMEQQGLSVENITIQLDSDVPSEHNLFDEQLAHSGASFADKKHNQSRGTFTMDLDSEEFEDENQSTQAGVNVTI